MLLDHDPVQQIDDPLERAVLVQRHVDRGQRRAVAEREVVDHLLVPGPFEIELVDQRHPWEPTPRTGLPQLDVLWLDADGGVEDEDEEVKDLGWDR